MTDFTPEGLAYLASVLRKTLADKAVSDRAAAILRGRLSSNLNVILAALERCGELKVWQPIESAPKDGTSFLACSDGWITVGFWHGGRARWTINAYTYPNYGPDDQPTHWMPLPTPARRPDR